MMDDSGKIILLLDFSNMDGNNAARPADSERFDDIIILVQKSYSHTSGRSELHSRWRR